jgi:hypothetical protein
MSSCCAEGTCIKCNPPENPNVKQIGSVITKIVTRVKWVDGNPQKAAGDPEISQLRVLCSPKKAAEEVPGLTSEQVYDLKKEGFITFWGEHQATLIRIEIVTAEEYERQYREQVAARDARSKIG